MEIYWGQCWIHLFGRKASEWIYIYMNIRLNWMDMCVNVCNSWINFSAGSDSFWEPGNYKRTTKWVHYDHLKNWFCKTAFSRIKTLTKEQCANSHWLDRKLCYVISTTAFYHCIESILLTQNMTQFCLYFWMLIDDHIFWQLFNLANGHITEISHLWSFSLLHFSHL